MRIVLLAGLCAAAISGCTAGVGGDTELQSDARLAAPQSCTLAGAARANASLSCLGGAQYRCSNGTWERVPAATC
jgi:hypothetical protein